MVPTLPINFDDCPNAVSHHDEIRLTTLVDAFYFLEEHRERCEKISLLNQCLKELYFRLRPKMQSSVLKRRRVLRVRTPLVVCRNSTGNDAISFENTVKIVFHELESKMFDDRT